MDRRIEGRRSTRLRGYCELANGSRHHVEIKDLSRAGCGLKGELDVGAGEQVKLSVAGIGPLLASVKWIEEGVAGIALAEALDPEVVSYLAAC